MRVGHLAVLPMLGLAACGVTGTSAPPLPSVLPPPPDTRADYDSNSAAPCSFEEPLLDGYCGFGVKLNGPGSADVYVTRPQGGDRKLTLRDGVWNSRGGVVAVKLSDGTSLTVNGNEFYQISEGVVLGE